MSPMLFETRRDLTPPYLTGHVVVEVVEERARQHPHGAVAHGLAVVVVRAARVRGARGAERRAVLVAAGQVHGVQLLVHDAQLQALGVASNGREEHAHLQHREDEDEAQGAGNTRASARLPI